MVERRRPSHAKDREQIRGAWRRSLPGAFVDAGRGAILTLRTERNMKIHYTAALLMVVWCLIVRPSTVWVMGVFVAISLMMTVELMNTAIEHVVDLVVGDTYRNEAMWAKDAAAGAVLVASMGAATVGVVLLCKLWPWKFLLLSDVHVGGACLSAVGLLVLLAWGLMSRWVHH